MADTPPKFTSLPSQIKEKALHRFAMGESASSIAKSMGVNPTTVSRWVKAAGVERGAALEPEANPLVVPQPDHVMDVFTQELRNQNTEAALKMFLDMQNGVEDKYRVLMAQQIYAVLHRVMQHPPQIKNWSDVEKAHKIMETILNPNKGGAGGGGRTRLDIQFEVIGAKPTTIDAEVVDEHTTPTDDAEDSGD